MERCPPGIVSNGCRHPEWLMRTAITTKVYGQTESKANNPHRGLKLRAERNASVFFSGNLILSLPDGKQYTPNRPAESGFAASDLQIQSKKQRWTLTWRQMRWSTDPKASSAGPGGTADPGRARATGSS